MSLHAERTRWASRVNVRGRMRHRRQYEDGHQGCQRGAIATVHHPSDICQIVRDVLIEEQNTIQDLLLGFNPRQLAQLYAQQIHLKRTLESEQLKLEHVLKIDSRTRRFDGPICMTFTQVDMLKLKREFSHKHAAPRGREGEFRFVAFQFLLRMGSVPSWLGSVNETLLSVTVVIFGVKRCFWELRRRRKASLANQKSPAGWSV